MGQMIQWKPSPSPQVRRTPKGIEQNMSEETVLSDLDDLISLSTGGEDLNGFFGEEVLNEI